MIWLKLTNGKNLKTQDLEIKTPKTFIMVKEFLNFRKLVAVINKKLTEK